CRGPMSDHFYERRIRPAPGRNVQLVAADQFALIPGAPFSVPILHRADQCETIRPARPIDDLEVKLRRPDVTGYLLLLLLQVEVRPAKSTIGVRNFYYPVAGELIGPLGILLRRG